MNVNRTKGRLSIRSGFLAGIAILGAAVLVPGWLGGQGARDPAKLPAIPADFDQSEDRQIIFADNLCGPNCLGVIASYFDKPASQAEILELTDGGLHQPVSMADLVRAANTLGLEARGVVAAVDEIRNLPFPLIAHVTRDGQGHFLVLSGFRDGNFRVIDPPKKATEIPASELYESLTGNVLIFSRPT
jgi:hypothetical protein